MTSEVNPQLHEIVLVLKGDAFPFMRLSSAILFLEDYYAAEDKAKLFNTIATAMSDDKDSDAEIQLYDIATYADMFLDDEDDNE